MHARQVQSASSFSVGLFYSFFNKTDEVTSFLMTLYEYFCFR